MRALIMKRTRWIPMLILPLVMAATVTTSEAQGKGKGQGAEKTAQGKAKGAGKVEKGPVAKTSKATMAQGSGQKVGQARGRSGESVKGKAVKTTLPASAYAAPRASASNRGRAVSRFARDLHVSDVRPAVRTYVISNKPSQFVTGGAVAYALARGAPENALLVVPTGNQVFLRNRKGDVLVQLDDNRARTLGAWQVAPLNDRVNGGAPSFCRSGAGHPVWGRQWCLDKGFGLGAEQNVRWGTTRSVGDIIFGR
jgi:hypothetical protein